jgi:membrane protein YdbS with pleckstrin-like domain
MINPMASAPFQIGEEFKPALPYQSYLYASLAVYSLIFVVPWLIPVFWFSPFFIAASLGAIFLITIVFVAYWIPLYYASVAYRLTNTEIFWKRGVWFQQTGIVPYNRITNVDILQGPLMRFFSFSALRVQTAGYSAQARAEIILNGIENPEELQDLIMANVRRTGPVATEGESEPPELLPTGAKDEVVEELRAIRTILEEIRR